MEVSSQELSSGHHAARVLGCCRPESFLLVLGTSYFSWYSGYSMGSYIDFSDIVASIWGGRKIYLMPFGIEIEVLIWILTFIY